jgi:hypothetical protein
VDGVDEIPDEIAGVEILDNGNPLLDRGNPLLDRTEDIAGADGTTEPEAEEREPGVESAFDEILGTDEDAGVAEFTDAAEDGAEIVTAEKIERTLDAAPDEQGETAELKEAEDTTETLKVDDLGVDPTDTGAVDGIVDTAEADLAEFAEAIEGTELVAEEKIEGDLDATPEREGETACPDFKDAAEEGDEALKVEGPGVDPTEIGGVQERAFDGILEGGRAEFTEAAEYGAEIAPEEKIEGALDTTPEAEGDVCLSRFQGGTGGRQGGA